MACGNPSRIIRGRRLPRLPAQPDSARGLVGVFRCAACPAMRVSPGDRHIIHHLLRLSATPPLRRRTFRLNLCPTTESVGRFLFTVLLYCYLPWYLERSLHIQLVPHCWVRRSVLTGLAEDLENSAWLYQQRNLNYMADADYLISKLRGTAESSVGTGAVVVAKSNINACKDALRYPSLGVVVGRILVQVVVAPVVFCGMSIALRGEMDWWGTYSSRCSYSVLLGAIRRCTSSRGAAIREGASSSLRAVRLQARSMGLRMCAC